MGGDIAFGVVSKLLDDLGYYLVPKWALWGLVVLAVFLFISSPRWFAFHLGEIWQALKRGLKEGEHDEA